MNFIKKSILLKNILILIVFGGISRILGMFGKITLTRIAGLNVLSIYSIVIPTFMLIITISQFSMPISVSKITSENKTNNNIILFNSLLISIILNTILIIIILLAANTLAKSLHNNNLSDIIKSISIIIPFISITSIQRGFLHGKQDMFLSSFTSILEEIIKILLIISIIPFAIKKSNYYAVIMIILFNCLMELSTIIILHIRIKKKYIEHIPFKFDLNIIKKILKISIPTTLIRLISSIGLFLEPIILTNALLKNGFLIDDISLEYAIINSYVIPLLLIPGFFSISIASALLPNITAIYEDKKYNLFLKKILKSIITIITIGIICLVIILLFPKELLVSIYNINLGINYIYILGPFFIFIYIQPIFSCILQASNNTNKILLVNIISTLTKYIVLYILCNKGYGINSYLYSIIIGIIIDTALLFIITINIIKKPN